MRGRSWASGRWDLAVAGCVLGCSVRDEVLGAVEGWRCEEGRQRGEVVGGMVPCRR
ncbi:uncharacterized protein DS421_9g280600 [Arachis hypogaea]|nr:uncharacterized protein DS421_9g280600 [Arachis hypogaea]